MADPLDLRSSVLAAWRTNGRVTSYLVEELPAALWGATIPGAPLRTVRMLVAHMHNARARWIRTLGRPHGVSVPALVDLRRVARRELLAALEQSGKGIEALLILGLEADNQVPPSPAYVWRNLPLDVGHVLTYFVAHEAHHRGQVVLLARQLGHRLPSSVTNGLWQWTTRQREGSPYPGGGAGGLG
ncbi:MAG: hypothetical protein EHM24_18010 [Acidobacteria bacterium]|nr:MAG: hypothetical protein EHM24_18010 [Acidobacteriota bacterium]